VNPAIGGTIGPKHRRPDKNCRHDEHRKSSHRFSPPLPVLARPTGARVALRATHPSARRESLRRAKILSHLYARPIRSPSVQ